MGHVWTCKVRQDHSVKTGARLPSTNWSPETRFLGSKLDGGVIRLSRLPELQLDNREIIGARLISPSELRGMTLTGPVTVSAGRVRRFAIQSDRATLLQCSRSFRPTRADGDRWCECQRHGLRATTIPYHIICMRGCVVRHGKDWPPMSESGQKPAFSPALPLVRSAHKSGHLRCWRLVRYGPKADFGKERGASAKGLTLYCTFSHTNVLMLILPSV
jgi:hypothetical protein